MTRIAVIVPSLGRPKVVEDLLEQLRRQTHVPEKIVIVVTKAEDAPPPDRVGHAEIIYSPLGTCAQRNTGLDHVGDNADLIAFFDDDFVPAPDYLERLVDFFEKHPEASGVTGAVLADGVTGPGLTFREANEVIEKWRKSKNQKEPVIETRLSLYGCNMAYRREAIMSLRFDERLPLYGWLEDVDFSMQVKAWGPLMKSSALVGVHLGVKGGRTSGVRFGYSQIINPIYLYRKKTMTLHHAFDNLYRNILSNHVKVFFPEPYVDRWGRLKGNWLGFFDLLRGKVNPERILDF